MLHRYSVPLFMLACAGISTHAAAQVSGSANATTTVVDPAVIAKVSDLDFGLISAEAGSSTLVVPPHESGGNSGASTSDAKAGPATITISGASDQSYSISLPKGAHILKRENGSETVTVEEFTTGIPEGLLLSGEQTIRLGATLSMEKEQAPGLYTAQSGISVIVNYN